MAKPSNCSLPGGNFPLSSEFFQVIKNELWIFLIPALVALIQLALFMEEMGFFFRNIRSSRRICLYLWILGVYPVFCMSSIIGMYVPRSSFVCNFVTSIYHSITLWKFLALITDFFGGKAQMLEQLEGEEVAPNPFPCCCCCCLPNISVNRVTMRWMTIAVFQLSAVRTILFFVNLILWTDEKYDYGDVGYTDPNSYINAIIGLSTTLSFYGYLLFYKATKSALQGYSLRSKFICIILVLVLCGLQSSILETMGALGAIPCNPPFSVQVRSQTIFYYSLTMEMFFIGLYARFCFRRAEPCPERDGMDVQASLPGKNKASQTELINQHSPSGYPDHDDLWVGTNPGYFSDSEDSLCHIEHTPLDKFDFSSVQGMANGRYAVSLCPDEQGQANGKPGGSHGSPIIELNNLGLAKTSTKMKEKQEECDTEAPTCEASQKRANNIQVSAQINYVNANEATVV
ncbi:organic solute transporter subunit alpha-like [Ambystoma mexicanum]|uniref:organic solute transporter subunit alpha-like n=1 Tax=Ambystoma mexicanum TaxID=8296 RepID=UPI0037E8D7FF